MSDELTLIQQNVGIVSIFYKGSIMFSETKQKKKHIKTVSQKLRLFRAKDPSQSVFMWGINHSINELKHIIYPPMLMPDDFKAYSKTKVDNHLFNKDNMPSHFKFKEYCPIVFRNLRERFSVEETDYLMSLTKDAPIDSDAAGRSGASFQMSYDRRFVIKTIVGEEVAEMHRILKTYHQHIVEKHGQTLLPHYLGMYRLTINDQESYKVVMKNVFSPLIPIHKKYDLKGSTVARRANEKEKSKDLPTFKDQDFISDAIKIHVGTDRKKELMDTIAKDVTFMSNLNLMDYSLLVGIHDLQRAEQEQADSDAMNSVSSVAAVLREHVDEDVYEERGVGDGYQSSPPDSPGVNEDDVQDISLDAFSIACSEECDKKELYFIGLIDILTHYGMKKRTAQAAKTVKHGSGAEISTVKPEQYARRFLEFIEKVLD